MNNNLQEGICLVPNSTGRRCAALPFAALCAFSALIFFTSGCASTPSHQPSDINVLRVTYHGWTNAYRIKNNTVEVMVVADVGRVMSFRFHGSDNVFWEDRSLDGQMGDFSKGWINFGGDKTWPAPESEWGRYTKKGWQPPPAFDSLPVKAYVEGDDVVLTSPVDPFYGIRTVRRISLEPHAPVLRIKTSYQRAFGDASQVAIWVITQFKDPEGVFVPMAADSLFTNGCFRFNAEPWPQLQPKDGIISITRDLNTPHKMGTDADRLLWMGKDEMCLVECPRKPNREYPDHGASAEVYTNPDPKRYVELETLGPLIMLGKGQSMESVNTYTLLRRGRGTPEQAARTVISKNRQ